jgi:hypothetical protein
MANGPRPAHADCDAKHVGPFVGTCASSAQYCPLNRVDQRTVFRLGGRIGAMTDKLPLRYFDPVQHGELLSRVTNDVDNISQSLQQSIGQAVTSAPTVAGVLATVPLTLVSTYSRGHSPSRRPSSGRWRTCGSPGLSLAAEPGHAGEPHDARCPRQGRNTVRTPMTSFRSTSGSGLRYWAL